MNFNFVSKIPLRDQIKSQIISYIKNGFLKPNEKLPSVRELATYCNCNPNTVSKVYIELESEGYIYSLSKRGCYVKEINIKDKIKDNFKDLVKEYTKQGLSIKDMIAILKEGDFND